MLGLHFSVAHKYKEDEYYKISWFPHMPLKFEKRCDLCISLPVDCHKSQVLSVLPLLKPSATN